MTGPRYSEIAAAARLPVDDAIPALRAALASSSNAVLQAPPGAGKTTHVPIALLHEPWIADSRILLLEPRRVAARAVTHRMAHLLGERVGETVGYRIRRDTRVGPATRIEVVTEGVLMRMLQTDPTLEGIGLVVFDEFHERSIHADSGLALVLQSQRLVRPDLRILVMSATLDVARIASLLGEAPVIASAGREHSVQVVYGVRPDMHSMAAAVANRVIRALADDDGDVLVFLPGGAEIRRVASLLEGRVPDRVSVERLHGDLSQQAQDTALTAARSGWRKVVLSTPIAETSLTIEGVTVVIDSGLVREPQFSARTGMSRLETVRISRASADQRAGRAGRVRPGKCYRLWPESEHLHLKAHSTPEILQADLAPLVLQLAAAGVGDPAELAWLDPPHSAAWARGTQLLSILGAVGPSGRITPHGAAMAVLPAHPRIAHMLLQAEALGAGAVACDVAALLGERDFLRGVSGPTDADIELRLAALRSDSSHVVHGAQVDHTLRRRIRSESAALSAALRGQLGIRSTAAADRIGVGMLLALAYPDRIAQSRGGGEGRFLLRGGGGATLTHAQGLTTSEFIVAAELDGDVRSGRIYLGATLDRADLERYFADEIETEDIVAWDASARVVRAMSRRRIGAIILKEWRSANPDRSAVTTVLLEVIRKQGVGALPWSNRAMSMRQRISFLRARRDEWPDTSDQILHDTLDQWLAPLLTNVMSPDELAGALGDALLDRLSWKQRADLDRFAPVHYVAPTGTRVRIDYSSPEAPSIAIRLQEMFGVVETPAVDDGRVALTVELLSPGRQPVQITRDLAGFWKGSYFEVRKQLRGQYPKHLWPDDPLVATPTTRARQRMK